MKKVFVLGLSLTLCFAINALAEEQQSAKTQVPEQATEKVEKAAEAPTKPFVMMPYYSLSFAEGSYYVAKGPGSVIINNSLTNDLGLIMRLFNSHTLLFFYQLKYTGPGVKKQEGKDFQEKAMDHFLFAQYQFKINDELSVKAKYNYLTEYYRAGTNEPWEDGTFNFTRPGVDLRVESKYFGVKVVPVFQMGDMTFPNYIELKKTTTTVTESLEGMQDQAYMQLGAIVEYAPVKVTLNYDNQAYKKKTITDVTTGVETATKQVDNQVSLNVFSQIAAGEYFEFTPSVDMKFKTSNGTYVHLPSTSGPGSTPQPPVVIANGNDYNQYSVGMGIKWKITPNNEISLSPDYVMKQYTTRPPKDAKGNLVLTDKQYTNILQATLGYMVRWNPASQWFFYYVYQQNSSNVQQERSVLYNYTTHFAGMKFQFTY
ncbi:MAG: hypothetical protein WC955_10055 [Elusimicrobiota bacterium]